MIQLVKLTLKKLFMKNQYTAKFIKKVTTLTSVRKNGHKYQFQKGANGQYYESCTWLKEYKESLKVGSIVYIAKLRQTPRHTDYTWDVYQIELPKMKPFHGHDFNNGPQTWFGSDTCIVTPCSKRLHNQDV
jgi:hypothetical protein